MSFRKVIVWVLEARDLPGIDHGTADPYVICTVGDERKLKAITHNVRKTLKPVWNAKVVISPVYLHHETKNVDKPYDQVRFEIKDWNRLVDKSMGVGYLKINPDWRDHELHEYSVELKGGKGTGVLKVRIATQRLYEHKHANNLKKIIMAWQKRNPGKQWEDPDFPCSTKSISFKGESKGAAAWKRVTDLSKTPHLFHDKKGHTGNAPRLISDKASASDVIQGALGDCWLLGAFAIVATRPKLIRALFVSSDVENGIYICKFFIHGDWRYVVINDLLPVGAGGSLVFAKCNNKDTFWVPLLEKAYAKMFRSYEAVEAGITAEALLDLTGEGAETFSIDDPKFLGMKESGELENNLKHWKKSRFLMGVSKTAEGAQMIEKDTGMGILAGHAYSVLDVKNPIVEPGFLGLVGNKRLVLIKLRNPWGEEEWKGAWSDGSKEWTPKIRKQLKHVDANDGVFWMNLDDFLTQFNRISVVRMYSTKFSIFDHKWHSFNFLGEWDEFSDGGCLNHETWAKNAQYGLEVVEEQGKTAVFVYLSQQDRRFFQKGEYDVSIGVYVIKVDNAHEKVMDKGKFRKTSFPPWDHGVPTFINRRDTYARVDLEKGQYIIIPCTFDQGKRQTFALGVFAERRVKAWEILSDQEHGVYAEWSDQTAGGPPDISELGKADKHGYPNDFYNNPKVVLGYKHKRRVEDDFHATVRVDVKGEMQQAKNATFTDIMVRAPSNADIKVGLRVYRKCKPHRPDPLKENLLLLTIPPQQGPIVKDLALSKKDGPFCFVAFTEKSGLKAGYTVSIISKQPGLKLDMYH